jgi:hypothetical protein
MDSKAGALGHRDRRPRVDPDDLVAPGRIQVAGRRSEVDPLQDDAGGEPGDRARPRSLGGVGPETHRLPAESVANRIRCPASARFDFPVPAPAAKGRTSASAASTRPARTSRDVMRCLLSVR